jgi:3-hydroxyisobutyrate dehydrogenase-like beta-hydroxyacid dehydrogenase
MSTRVAIVATGDMGNATGRLLREGGAAVSTCLAGRSERTRKLAEKAGITVVADDDALVAGADVFLSIIPPGEVVKLAERVAAAMKRTGATPVYVDCNAVSAKTMQRIAGIIAPTGGTLVDVGIIGPPPAKGAATKFYASGPKAPSFDGLKAHGLDVRWCGDAIGDASTLKMCYGGLTKGLQALATTLMISAQHAGIGPAFEAELKDSQQALLGWLDRSLPRMPPKAYRWVAEMEEGAATFEAAGLPGEMMIGAARLYDWIAQTPLGKETVEDRSLGTNREAMIEQLAACLKTVGLKKAS